MQLGDIWSNALRPDSQAFDEIRIFTVPRYKTSGLSGDEWRISATVQLIRKEKVIKETGYGNVEYATRLLSHFLLTTIENGEAYFTGEGDSCDQEGCAHKATVFYQLKKSWCSSCGTPKDTFSKSFRKFCEIHKRRGDCGLDDADANYILLENDPREIK